MIEAMPPKWHQPGHPTWTKFVAYCNDEKLPDFLREAVWHAWRSAHIATMAHICRRLSSATSMDGVVIALGETAKDTMRSSQS